MDLQPGTVVDVWCVEKRLGSGGMGAVYRCFNRAAPRIRAALKILDPSLAYDPEIRARFIREAEVLFQLEHPHIVKVRNVNMEASPPFIEMAFCQGTPLDALLRKGPLAPGVVALIGKQLCEALAHVHEKGIRHRDVKPGNVIVNGDHATLVDFGIATEGAHRTMNLKGSALGTVAYAPPEWGGRTAADPVLWDAYSLGVLLWECLTGRVAFPMPADMDIREGVFSVLARKAEAGVLDLDPSVPEVLRTVIAGLTKTRPEERRGDLVQVAAELATLAASGTGALPTLGALDDPTVVPNLAGPQGTQTMAFGEDPAGPPLETGVFDLSAAPGALPLPKPAAPAPPDRGASEGAAASGVATTQRDPQDSLIGLTTGRIPVATRSAVPRIALLAVGLAGVGGVAWWTTQDPTQTPTPAADAPPRVVQVVLEGAPPPGEVQVWVDESQVDPDQGIRLTAAAHRFVVRAGVGCGDPADRVPASCGTEERSLTIPAGDTVFPVRLRYPESAPATATVTLEGASASRARIDDGPWVDVSGTVWTAEDLSAGPHTLVVQGGTCPDAPCGEACPETCSEATGAVDAPFAATEPLALTLTLPARKAPAASKGGSGRGRISKKQFASWVKKNPQYHPSRARGSSLADSRYLKSWSVDAPGSGAAHQVSPIVAASYCKRGLAPVGAAPTSWSPSDGVLFELRSGPGGVPVLLNADGTQGAVSGKTSVTKAGFRCR